MNRLTRLCSHLAAICVRVTLTLYAKFWLERTKSENICFILSYFKTLPSPSADVSWRIGVKPFGLTIVLALLFFANPRPNIAIF